MNKTGEEMTISDAGMTADDCEQAWPDVNLDEFSNLQMMQVETLKKLQHICSKAKRRRGWQHRINSDYRSYGSGQHTRGTAVDIVFYKKALGDVSVVKQYLFALRFEFNGVGIYPHWMTPGIHIDTRSVGFKAMWYCDNRGRYISIDRYIKKPKG